MVKDPLDVQYLQRYIVVSSTMKRLMNTWYAILLLLLLMPVRLFLALQQLFVSGGFFLSQAQFEGHISKDPEDMNYIPYYAILIMGISGGLVGATFIPTSDLLSDTSTTLVSSNYTLFAVLKPSSCANSLMYGPSALSEDGSEDGHSAYLCTDPPNKDVEHTEWLQVINFESGFSSLIYWTFDTPRILQDHFIAAVDEGVEVVYTVESWNDPTFSTEGQQWRFSPTAGDMSQRFAVEESTSGFSDSYGVWGTGEAKASFWGIGNFGGSDVDNCKCFWRNGSPTCIAVFQVVSTYMYFNHFEDTPVGVAEPSAEPTPGLTEGPSPEPSIHPSFEPSVLPSTEPSTAPSAAPSTAPSAVPSTAPSPHPSSQPSLAPVTEPTDMPSMVPTASPTESVTAHTSSESPVAVPSHVPSVAPSVEPTVAGSTEVPTVVPLTEAPTVSPTPGATARPSTESPVPEPTMPPSVVPTAAPTREPTASMSSLTPIAVLTPLPSLDPTVTPTRAEPEVDVSMWAEQIVDGISLAAYTDNRAACNEVFHSTIAFAAVTTRDAVTSLTVTAPRELNRAHARTRSLRAGTRGTTSADAVSLQYTIQVPARNGVTFEHLASQLTFNVAKGVFTTALRNNSAAMNVSALSSAYSSYVTIRDTAPNIGEPNTDSSSKLSMDIVAGIVVGVLAFVMISVCVLVSRYRRYNSKLNALVPSNRL